jgi:hypothetical protein
VISKSNGPVKQPNILLIQGLKFTTASEAMRNRPVSSCSEVIFPSASSIKMCPFCIFLKNTVCDIGPLPSVFSVFNPDFHRNFEISPRKPLKFSFNNSIRNTNEWSLAKILKSPTIFVKNTEKWKIVANRS